MHHETVATAGWLINGFQATVMLAVWSVVVFAYGFFWRSMSRPDPDPIRPSGPLED